MTKMTKARLEELAAHARSQAMALVIEPEIGELIRLSRLGLQYEQLMNTPLCVLTKDERSLALQLVPGAITAIEPAPELPSKPHLVIKRWCDLYKLKYGASYDIDKKIAGIIKKKCEQWSFQKFSVLFQCYLSIDEKFYREQKHPLSLFFRDIQKINVAAQTRNNPKTEKIDRLFKKDE